MDCKEDVDEAGGNVRSGVFGNVEGNNIGDDNDGDDVDNDGDDNDDNDGDDDDDDKDGDDDNDDDIEFEGDVCAGLASKDEVSVEVIGNKDDDDEGKRYLDCVIFGS